MYTLMPACVRNCRRSWTTGVLIAALLSIAAATGHAGPLQRNLSDGLVYFRVKTLPADLPTDDTLPKHATIVDLRYTKGDTAGASVLGSWLKFHAAPRTPVFVLVNSSTASTLIHVLEDRDIPGVLTVGVAGMKFTPDIAVEGSADDERRAYEALELGTTVRALTTDNPDKIRNDEASLAHDRSADADASDDATVDSDKPVPAKPPPLIDRALQRAIQLYKGLKAMKAD